MLLNNISLRSAGALGLLMVAAAASRAGSLAPQKAKADARALSEARRLLADRSARFVENKGQWNREARFLARGRGLNLWFTDRGLRYDQTSTALRRRQAVDMFFVGGKPIQPVGVEKTNSRQDVYRGDLQVKNIGSYHELIAKDVLPGVSMRSYFDKGRPRYDLILAPGTDPLSVKLGYRGANGLSLKNGALKIGTRLGGIYNGRPVAYQMIDGKRRPVAAKWSVAKTSVAGFKLGAYDEGKPLVIDPLVYGSYFGGEQGPDDVRAAVSDTTAAGVDRGLIVVGASASPDYPGLSFPFTDTLNPAQVDAFIARIDATGAATDFSVLFGSLGNDVAQYLKLDPVTRDLWIAGTTVSDDDNNTFPATLVGPAGSQTRDVKGTVVAGANNVFVARFTHLADGTLSFGVDGSNQFRRVATVFGLGTATASISGFDIRTFPSVPGVVQLAFTGNTDEQLPDGVIPSETDTPSGNDNGHVFPGHRAGFLERFTADGTQGITPGESRFGVYTGLSQYVEGSRLSELRGVALDNYGRAYVVGTVYQAGTANPNLQNVDTSAFPSYFQTKLGNSDNFDANGSTMLPRLLRATDVFVRIYKATNVGSQSLEYSALLGGNGIDDAGGMAVAGTGGPIYTGNAIAINADGTMYVTGTTNKGNNFPHTAGSVGDGFFPPSDGLAEVASDIFVSRISINRDGGIASNTGIVSSRLDFSGNLGVTSRLVNGARFPASDPASVMPAGIAVDPMGFVYITGNLRPYSISFPITAGSPNTPDAYTLSAIPLTTKSATAVLDPTYDSPATPQYPTTEAFLAIVRPAGNEIFYSTYIGGMLDDLAFAPGFDAAGNVIVTGWSDGARFYQPPVTSGNPPNYETYSALPPALLGGLNGAAPVKPNSDSIFPDQAIPYLFSDVFPIDPFAYTSTHTNPGGNNANPLIGVLIARDGYVLRINPDLPTVAPLAINFAFTAPTIEPLASTTATVSVNAVQALDTRVRIQNTNGIRISTNSLGGFRSDAQLDLDGVSYDPVGAYYYVVVPSGQSSVTFTVTSTKYGNGLLASFTASVVSDTQSSSQTQILTVRPLNYTVALSPSVLTADQTPGTVTGTVTIVDGLGQVRALPAALTFNVTVPDTTNNRSLFPNATPNNGFLGIATVTIDAGQSTATFTTNVNAVSSPTTVTVTVTAVAPASLLDGTITRSGQLSAQPVSVTSIVATPNPIRSSNPRARLRVTVTFSGPPLNPNDTTFTFSVPGAFRRPVGASLQPVAGTTNQFVAEFTPTRVSRSTDVTITATLSGTSARTVVTLIR